MRTGRFLNTHASVTSHQMSVLGGGRLQVNTFERSPVWATKCDYHQGPGKSPDRGVPGAGTQGQRCSLGRGPFRRRRAGARGSLYRVLLGYSMYREIQCILDNSHMRPL